MQLTLAFSPCPNDTYIFDALINKKIDCGGFEFNYITEDISKLNKLAENEYIDIIKLSFSTFFRLENKYTLLNSGSALGYGNGPLLISKRKIYPDEVSFLKIAIPGFNTTANMLLSAAYPEAKIKKEYLFSDIEEVVLADEADAGLIIHETRFTYEKKGLQKIVDLGEWWEKETNLPIPLGCIAASNKLGKDTIKNIENLIKESILYAIKNPDSSLDFIKKLSQEKDEEIIKKHIFLYVNKYSVELGEKGRKAIEALKKHHK
jgi:1,4-dihydroxy-6-naphthoate synthase